MGKGGAGCGGLPKNKKRLPYKRSHYIVRHHFFGGWGCRGVRVSLFQFGPKQEIETLVHEQW